MFDIAKLDQMRPGVELAAFLEAVDWRVLAGHERIIVLKARQRMASYYAAQVYDDMAAVSDAMMNEFGDDIEAATESAAAEIRAALHLTRRAADAELSLALDLRARLPRVWHLLAEGRIDVRRAWVMVKSTSHLSMAAAREVVEEVIDQAPHLTTGQLGALMRRKAIEADPEGADERYRHATEQRRLVSEATVDGTAHLFGLDLPPSRVTAVARRVNQIARSLRAGDESRTMDQLRADVFLDLLQGRIHGSRAKGTVDIRVDMKTLAELADHPGELAGYGPVIADIARQTARNQQAGEWRFTVTDAEEGGTVGAGVTRRRPTASQKRAVHASDETCVFPGCRMPATDCDLDHRIPYSENGATTPSNLVPLCRHDHRIRHEAGWKHERRAGGGHVWISRLGHRYVTSGRPP
jgi:hypothetical protein